MKFAREKADAVFKEIEPLIHLHYIEISHYQDIALSPDWEMYSRLEAMGSLRVFTARNDDAELIGYSIFFVRSNLHYKDSLQAVQDILFINPLDRGFGLKFILWCDEQLKGEKVQAVYHHVKKSHNFGPLLERIGYNCVDLIYAKRLDL